MFKKVVVGMSAVVVVMILAIFLVLGKADAGSVEEVKAREELKIGVSWKTMQEERWVTELEEIKKVCEEQGIEMLYQCSEGDSQKQVGQIENLISQDIDILIVIAPEKAAVDNVLQEAHDAGVFVAYYEQVGGETYFDFSGGNDYFEVGQTITKTIADMGITGDVCYLYGDSAGGSGVINFRDGMQDSMKDCDVNVVGEQFVTNWDPATGMGYVENWLAEYADTLSAVLCMNDGLAGGAVQALENENLDGKVLVCGQDCDLAACQRIAAGTQVSTVRKGGVDYARKFTETVIDYYLGEIKAEDFLMTDTNSLGEEKPFMSYTKYGARDLLLHSDADYIQCDGTRAGGFTEMLKIGALTQAFNVKFAPHAMENIHIHLVSAFNNAPFLERLKLFEGITANTYLDAPKPENGFMTIPDLPGLGLKLNMDFINEHDEKF
ncbi:MAG: substrate-binding domain-containing protein [Ruminococcus sp.]|nr:substrate-binding domain-containing protein [Ruminococcus sp.]